MNPLEIALIIIGIIIIIISCKLVDKSDKSIGQAAILPFSYENSISDNDKKKLIEKLEELLSGISEETVIRTDDTLSKLSNEKIMAVNEFSEQILEKMKRNHEEVVFLYHMLNDKEKELKTAMIEIDSSKKKVKDIIEANANTQTSQVLKEVKSQTVGKPVTQAAHIEKQLKAPILQKELKDKSKEEMPALPSLNSNNNTRILALHSQGKTVMEISKILGLGQGEVKLVIDLFKGKK